MPACGYPVATGKIRRMKKTIALLLVVFWPQYSLADLLDVDFRKLASQESVNLAEQYKGVVTLVVNTASRCGYTPQFSGLDELHDEYRESGFAVLGFPSNDFAGQDPGPGQLPLPDHPCQDQCLQKHPALMKIQDQDILKMKMKIR